MAEEVQELRVIAPIPAFPAPGWSFGPYASLATVPDMEIHDSLKVFHPRYLNIPRVGMHVQPDLMASALLPAAKALVKSGFDFDVIDAYYFYPDGVAAAILAERLNKPLVITAYGNDLSLIALRSPRAAKRIRDSARQAGSNTAVCKALADALTGLGIPGDKVHVVLHGVDLELFHPPEDRSSLRERLKMTRPSLLCAGHLIERKGMHFAIEAIAGLPDTELFIAGDGPEESSLRKRAMRLKVADRVNFLGHLNQDMLRDFLGAADAFVLMSSREGIANVIMESLACGTPVVATAIWGTPEVICVPEAGRLVPERSANALISSIRELFLEPPNRQKTRAYAENFTWTRTTQDHLKAIAQALDGFSR